MSEYGSKVKMNI